MKKIGILGGTSYPSTMLYYETLNKLYNTKFGDHHSCPIILYSIDYQDIKSKYNHDWENIPKLLENELRTLLSCNPYCIIIANNTLHKAFDVIKNNLNIEIPVFHIIELTKAYIHFKSYKNVLLLGTRFTMEDDYFKKPLIDSGINIIIPDDDERIKIQEIQTSVSAGNPVEKSQIEYFEMLNEKYADLDAFILGCTEIPVIYKHIGTKMNIIDTTILQCEKAMSIFNQNE